MHKPRLVLSLLALLMPVAALAQTSGLYVVHGINGTDIGAAEALPVDIAVDGACAITDFQFRDIAGPIDLPSGDYTVEISLSDGACGGTVAVTAEIDLRPGRTYTAVAHLDGAGAPTAALFRNFDDPTRPRAGRLIVRHGAVAPSVDVLAQSRKKRSHGAVLENFANGDQAGVTLTDKMYNARIYAAGTKTLAAGPVKVPITRAATLYVYAVGSLANDTFELLVQSVDHE